MTQQRSTVQQNFINGEIERALSRAGLPHNHAIRRVLDSEAQFIGVRNAGVNCNGESLDSRIKELQNNPEYKHTFTQPLTKVAKNDIRELTKNFDAIAAGTAVVD